jgi:hypothetical protein
MPRTPDEDVSLERLIEALDNADREAANAIYQDKPDAYLFLEAEVEEALRNKDREGAYAMCERLGQIATPEAQLSHLIWQARFAATDDPPRYPDAEHLYRAAWGYFARFRPKDHEWQMHLLQEWAINFDRQGCPDDAAFCREEAAVHESYFLEDGPL